MGIDAFWLQKVKGVMALMGGDDFWAVAFSFGENMKTQTKRIRNLLVEIFLRYSK